MFILLYIPSLGIQDCIVLVSAPILGYHVGIDTETFQTIRSPSPVIFVWTSRSALFVLSDYTCASSLHMVYVIFAHFHLYFKSPHLVTHFSCLAHSAVHILVSTSYKAPGSLSAGGEKKNSKEENKWDCYIS